MCKDGSTLQCLVSAQAERDDKGKIQRLLAVVQDVTERNRAEAEKKNALKEIERLNQALKRERDYLREEVKVALNFGQIIGNSSAIERVMKQVEVVAPTDAPVMIFGESGTGKELIASAIHEQSTRRDAAMVRVNCGAIPRELFESEFFGHIKGSFTGALKNRTGRFELANRGTLFLDEVAEIPLDLQSKLLRVLQEGEFERVGDDRTRQVDVRVIAATNKDLKVEMREKRFREDLFFRLNVIPIGGPAAARKTRRYRAARDALCRPSQSTAETTDAKADRSKPARAAGLPLARQHSRAAECDRARRDPVPG